jgi:arylsulfatase A-like enzyme/tetratricopeptide (TPR) repeat protein
MFSLIVSLVGCAGAPDATPPPATPDRPNVLIVTLDTLRVDYVGAYGGTIAKTPTLDALARAGVRADRAYTVTPLTIPAHSSLFTGLLPPRHGVQDNGDYFLGPEAVTLAERLSAAGYDTMASVGAEVTSRHWGFAQGFGAYHDDMGDARLGAETRWQVERRGDQVVRDAIAWLDEREGAGPWFGWVHLFDCHDPYDAPEPYRSQLPEQPYAAEVSWTDAQLGALVDALKSRGEYDNTWIFVMADHGEGLGSHGEARHGVLLYDATTRVPFVIKPAAGHPAGLVLTTPVSLVDVVPTVLAAVGAPPDPSLDGVDLAPLFGIDEAPPSARERVIYIESLYAWHHYGWAPQRALVDAGHKLIASTTPEVYAVGDRRETKNLAPSEPALTELLQARLAALRAGLVGPGEGARTAATMSPAVVAQLEALGYVTETPDVPTEEVGLPDPVSQLPILGLVEDGRRAIARGDFSGGLAALDAAMAADPDLLEPRLIRSFALASLGRLDEAVRAAEEAAQMRRSSATLTALANLRVASGDPEEGAELFAAAIEIDPYQAVPWSRYLLLLQGLDRRDELAAAIERCRSRLPDLLVADVMAAHLDLVGGDVAVGVATLRRVVATNPDEPVAWQMLGAVYREQGDAEAAEAAFLEELRVNPGALGARRYLVAMYAEQKRYAEQAAQLEVILRAEPGDRLSWYALAQARFNLKEYELADKAVGACTSIDPDDPRCVMLHANVLQKLGRPDEARAEAERARALVAP